MMHIAVTVFDAHNTLMDNRLIVAFYHSIVNTKDEKTWNL